MPRSTLPIVIARLGRPGGRRIVLVGHTDVVPPGDPATWTVDPWAGEVRDGQLYGRGACDMKGGVAAILGRLRALGDAGAVDGLTGEVVVAFVPSEEDGGQGMLAAIRAGVTGDMAVITGAVEPRRRRRPRRRDHLPAVGPGSGGARLAAA